MRTDRHVPSRFVVADYVLRMAFSVGYTRDGFPYDEEGLDALVNLADDGDSQMADTHDKNRKALMAFASCPNEFVLNCDICGAVFKHGCLIEHKDGELLLIGHECARSLEDARETGRVNRLVLTALKAKKARAKRAGIKAEAELFLENHPELAVALECDNRFIRNVRESLYRWGNLSENQVTAVMRVAQQVEERKAEEADTNWIALPTGRTTVVGTVLSTKDVETPYGETTKMLVLVDTPAGSFKVYGTVPSDLVWVEDDGVYRCVDIKGKRIKFDARLEGKELGFGFFSRPTKAEVL